MPGDRALRGRGDAEDGLLARPERPRRCTLPITAFRVIPPSSAAIWLAESPSVQSFLSNSTRSSVHDMSRFPYLRRPRPAESFHAARPKGRCQTRSRYRHWEPSTTTSRIGRADATIWLDSRARVGRLTSTFSCHFLLPFLRYSSVSREADLTGPRPAPATGELTIPGGGPYDGS